MIIVGPVSVSVGLATADDDSALAAVSTGPIDTAPVAAPWSTRPHPLREKGSEGCAHPHVLIQQAHDLHVRIHCIQDIHRECMQGTCLCLCSVSH